MDTGEYRHQPQVGSTKISSRCNKPEIWSNLQYLQIHLFHLPHQPAGLQVVSSLELQIHLPLCPALGQCLVPLQQETEPISLLGQQKKDFLLKIYLTEDVQDHSTKQHKRTLAHTP